MSKLFTIGGTSVHTGKDGVARNTFRVATGKLSTRLAVLKRNKHTDIVLQELAAGEPGLTKAQWEMKLTAEGVVAVWPTSSKKEQPAAPVVELTKEQKQAAAQAKRKATIAAKKLQKEQEAAAEAAGEGSGGTPALEDLNKDHSGEAENAAEVLAA